ncbi:WD domain, G-beta repeat [Symmachiella dynata]|uniref:WD40 repeat domain-containing protein n=1 Tax=Symmachiella dynata TaxID=2527995 RepID=UPI001187AE51|nr:WD40 repeat domain-containing protein [Symmachiella dynata]QDT49612.1 WD domain, G-beta repeat [Symmachiella dynata]
MNRIKDVFLGVFLPVAFALVVPFAASRAASADDDVRLPAMPEMEFKMRRWSLSSVAFSPNGEYLASADVVRSVYLWNLKTRVKAWEVSLPPVGAVSEEEIALTFAGDGKMLVLAPYYRDPLVLDASSGKTLRTLGSDGEGFAPAVSSWRKDGTEMVVTSSSGNLHFWNPLNGKETMVLKGAGRNVFSLQVAKDAARIALGWESYGLENKLDSGRMLVRKLPSGRIVFDERQPHSPAFVRHLAISPNGEYLVGASGKVVRGSGDEALVCWSMDRRERLWSKEEDCGGLAMSPDGKMLAYGSGSRLVLCDVRTGTTLSSTTYGTQTISAVTFSGDGTSIAIGTDDGAVAVWNLLLGREEKGSGQRSEKR